MTETLESAHSRALSLARTTNCPFCLYSDGTDYTVNAIALHEDYVKANPTDALVAVVSP